MKPARILITALIIFGLAPMLHAGKTPKVRITIKAIYASTGPAGIDARLNSIKAYLKEGFGQKYTSFKLIEEQSAQLKRHQAHTMQVDDYGKVSIRYKGISKQFLRFQAKFKDLKINIRLNDGGVFIQAGRKYRKGIIIFVVNGERVP